MVPLKPLSVSLILLFLGGCMQMRNDDDDDDDDCSTEKQNTIQKRMTNNQITDDQLKSIALEIWNSVADLNVQYDGKLDAKGNGNLFIGDKTTSEAIGNTFTKFTGLFKFYNKKRGVEDPCVKEKKKECDNAQNEFLNDIFKERPIEILGERLRDHLRQLQINDLKEHLKEMWFTAYRSKVPDGKFDSSGFEHVFLGEITQKKKVTGLHNWMRMYLEEVGGHFFKLSEAAKYYPDHKVKTESNPFIADAKFTWNGTEKKHGSSFFMKKSPALEIALYTLCFMARPNNQDCLLKFGAFDFSVKAIASKSNQRLICKAYPVIP